MPWNYTNSKRNKTNRNMKKLIQKIKRNLVGQINIDVKQHIGEPNTKTVNNVTANYSGAKIYSNPFN